MSQQTNPSIDNTCFCGEALSWQAGVVVYRCVYSSNCHPRKRRTWLTKPTHSVCRPFHVQGPGTRRKQSAGPNVPLKYTNIDNPAVQRRPSKGGHAPVDALQLTTLALVRRPIMPFDRACSFFSR